MTDGYSSNSDADDSYQTDTMDYTWLYGQITGVATNATDKACLGDMASDICTGDGFSFWQINSIDPATLATDQTNVFGMVGLGIDNDSAEYNKEIMYSINKNANDVSAVIGFNL